MKLRPILLGLVAVAAATSCAGERVTHQDLQALHYAVRDAQITAADAESQAQQQEYRIEELESRLDYICAMAPRLC